MCPSVHYRQVVIKNILSGSCAAAVRAQSTRRGALTSAASGGAPHAARRATAEPYHPLAQDKGGQLTY